MNFITVLDQNNMITETKYEGELKENIIGKTVTTFYDEQKEVFGYSLLNTEISNISGQDRANDLTFRLALLATKELVNAIPNLPEDMLQDLRLENRDEPSKLRFFEYVINRWDEFQFTRTKILNLDELKEKLNDALFLINIVNSLMIIYKEFQDKKDFIINLRFIVLQIKAYIDYELIPNDFNPEDEQYEEKTLTTYSFTVIPSDPEYYAQQSDFYFDTKAEMKNIFK